MSLQDESFPEDEFLEELNLSSNPRQYQYPINRNDLYKQPNSSTTNTSSSSTDQNVSSESGNERPGSDLSGKTNASDPTGLTNGNCQKSEIHNKAYSYMDIHSEYTKRRYKHVESKVGQYIAKMKAEDQKLRNKQKKFQRHLSMPDTIGRKSEDLTNLDSNSRHLPTRYSAMEIRKFDDSSDAEADSSDNRSTRNQNELSGDMLIVKKQAYSQLLEEKERIQSYNDYLQQRLDEKSGEVVRLKQNIDTLRFEVTDCKEKLKRQSALVTNHCLNHSLGLYNQGNLSAFNRQSSLQVFTQHLMRTSTATQTELISPSPIPPQPRSIPSEMYTPESLDSNNNSLMNENQEAPSKCTPNVIQNEHLNSYGVLRQRSNSNQMMQPLRQDFDSHRGYLRSNDSAIDIDSGEMNSPIGHRFRREKRTIRVNSDILNTSFVEFSPQNENNENINNSSSDLLQNNGDNSGYQSGENQQNNKKNKKKKKKTLRWRMIRLLGPCANCEEPSTADISFTQVPLVDLTPEKFCRNMR